MRFIPLKLAGYGQLRVVPRAATPFDEFHDVEQDEAERRQNEQSREKQIEPLRTAGKLDDISNAVITAHELAYDGTDHGEGDTEFEATEEAGQSNRQADLEKR